MEFSGVTMAGGFNVAPLSAPVVPTDTYWANVSYLSETTSTNAQTNNTFLDSSTNNFTVTRVGTPTQGSFTPFTIASGSSYSTSTNGGSGYFNGNPDALTLSSNAAFSPGTGDFTIECWVYRTVAWDTYNPIFVVGGTNGIWFGKTDTGFGLRAFGVANLITATAPSLNTWTHVAVSRSGTNLRLFYNGVQQGSTVTNSTNFPQFGGYVGWDSTTVWFNGYISSLRLVKGTAVYTGNFTPSTTPLTAISGTSVLLNFTNAGMYDAAAKNNMLGTGTVQASTTQAKWAPTSAYFNGSSSLSTPSNTVFGYGTGDFTIEFWVYLNALGDQTIVSNLSTAASVAPHIYYGNGVGLIYYTNSGARITGAALSTGVWYYIALARASGSTKMFINGTQTGSTYTDTNNYGSANPLGIGDYGTTLSGASRLNGYIQDVRITKGVARYTATFTPPTEALPTAG
jgi:hypothetical protein